MTDDDLRHAYAPIAAREPGTRAGCPEPEALWAAGTGAAGADRAAVLMHVAQCAACRRDLALARAVHAAGVETGGAGIIRAPWPRRWLAAAALAVAVGAAALTITFRGAPVERAMRGAERAIVVVGPSGEVPAAAPVMLIWHPVPDARRYTVEILAPSGEAPVSASTADTTLMVGPAVLVAGARYRWTVSAIDGSGARWRSPATLIIRQAP